MIQREEVRLASQFWLLQRKELFPSKENVNFISREQSHKEPEQSSLRLDCASWKWPGRVLVLLPCLKIRCVSQQPFILLIFKTDYFPTNSELTVPVFKITLARLHSHTKDSPEDRGYSVFPTVGLNKP